MAQIVHDAPLIRIDTSLPTRGGLVRNGYLLPGTQVLESSITSSCIILHSYRLRPTVSLFINAGISVLVIGYSGTVWDSYICAAWRERLQPFYGLRNPCGFKVENPPGISPPGISPPSLMQLGATICG